MTPSFRQSLLALPGIGFALLPKLICPMCWPLYAGIMSSVGLGFLIGTSYLLPITSVFLVLTLAVLGFRAKQRRGHSPFVVGVVAATAVIIGKFYLDSTAIMYGGILLLVIASVWNALPRRRNTAACRSCARSATGSGIKRIIKGDCVYGTEKKS
jgi:mercuric ion transport protein